MIMDAYLGNIPFKSLIYHSNIITLAIIIMDRCFSWQCNPWQYSSALHRWLWMIMDDYGLQNPSKKLLSPHTNPPFKSIQNWSIFGPFCNTNTVQQYNLNGSQYKYSAMQSLAMHMQYLQLVAIIFLFFLWVLYY